MHPVMHYSRGQDSSFQNFCKKWEGFIKRGYQTAVELEPTTKRLSGDSQRITSAGLCTMTEMALLS